MSEDIKVGNVYKDTDGVYRVITAIKATLYGSPPELRKYFYWKVLSPELEYEPTAEDETLLTDDEGNPMCDLEKFIGRMEPVLVTRKGKGGELVAFLDEDDPITEDVIAAKITSCDTMRHYCWHPQNSKPTINPE